MDSELLKRLVGQVVVVDLASSYVCLGELAGLDDTFLRVKDADLHDFRDSAATREIYVYDSKQFGIRRNRAQVLVKLSDVVAIARLADILES